MAKHFITRDLETHADHVVISGSIHNELWALERGLIKGPHFNERRAYIMSLFAMVEGISLQLRKELLRLNKLGQVYLTLDEEFILSEVEIRLDKGKAKRALKRYPTEELFLYTIHCYAKHLSRTEEVGSVLGDKGKDAFKAAAKKRHSLTHPKTSEDTQVSDSEWKMARAAWAWYHQLYVALLNGNILEEMPDKE
jgi:hypothetical protein